jgi:DNA-binding transcriptional ArsR family regulator
MLVIRDPEQAATLLQPERLRLLEALAEPDSAAGLARRFDLPRQRLNYHLKELERSGLVKLVEERRKGNCIERVVRATARAYTISPEVLGGLAEARGQIADRLSATYLVAVASRAIRELGALLARAAAARKRVATLTFDTEIRFASAEARADFADELGAAMARLASKYHDPSATAGRTFRVIAGAYPKPADTSAATPREEIRS